MVNRAVFLQCLVIASLLIPHQGAFPQEAEKISKDMFKVVIRPQDSSRLAINPKTIDIDQTTVTVKEGDTVSDLLEQKGIKSTNDSLSVVYQLNPTLESADNLKPGDTILMPKVADPQQIEHDKGYLVYLFGNPENKKKLIEYEKEIGDLGIKLDQLPANDQRQQIIDAIETTKASIQTFRSEEAIVSPEMHEQINMETKLIIDLSQKASTGEILTEDELETLNEGKADIGTKSANGRNNPYVLVKVKTVKVSEIGTTVENGFRVCRAPRALYKKYPETHRKFAKLSSPTESDVLVGMYKFWAEKNDVLASEVLDVNVERQQESEVMEVEVIIKE